MRKILALCLVTVLVPGFMAGCSKNEQPVQEQPLAEQSNVMMAQPLQDMVTQAGDQAKQVVDEAKSTAGEAVEAVQAHAAKAVSGVTEQLQKVSTLPDMLKTDAASNLQSTEAGLSGLTEEVPSAPAVPDQSAVETAAQEVKDLTTAQTEGLKTPLDSALSGLDAKVADTTSSVTQAASEAGMTATETAEAATNETANAAAAGTTSSDEVVNTAEDAAAVLADTTSTQI